MLLQSLGVSHMKLEGLLLRALTNSESEDDWVEWKFAQRETVLISLNSRNPKWSADRGGLKLQVPEPEASSAHACQVSPALSIRSTMFGELMVQQQLPSLLMPKVSPPTRAM